MPTKNDKPNLREYDFGDRIRDKNGLSYVSWADIWDVCLQLDADASYEVCEFPHPDNLDRRVPYQSLDIGAMVWVSLTLLGKTRKAYLPVMDFKNKTIPSPTATDINNAIQRCLSKSAAMHGLSLYVYRGEDVSPALEANREAEREELSRPVNDEQLAEIVELLTASGADEAKFCQFLKVESVECIQASQYSRAVKALKKKAEAAE